eukprot:Polyplicarium_translucidae@DN2221_c0_g1_i1.p2
MCMSPLPLKVSVCLRTFARYSFASHGVHFPNAAVREGWRLVSDGDAERGDGRPACSVASVFAGLTIREETASTRRRHCLHVPNLVSIELIGAFVQRFQRGRRHRPGQRFRANALPGVPKHGHAWIGDMQFESVCVPVLEIAVPMYSALI